MADQHVKLKRKRTSLDISQKAEIIQSAERGERQIDIAIRYGVARNIISAIVADKERLLTAWETGRSGRRAVRSSGQECRNGARCD